VDDDRERQGVADSANCRDADGTGDPTIDHDPAPGLAKAIQRIGVAADHGGFELAQDLIVRLRGLGHDMFDFGDRQRSPDDDYPDFVIPLAYEVARGDMERGVAICGSGVGATVANYESTCAKRSILGLNTLTISDQFRKPIP
jgi:hypothetical protein